MSLHPKIICRTGISAILTLVAMQAARADSPTTTGSVTVTGSTAFSAFFQSPGSTNDFIDLNNDGIFGFNNAGGSGPSDTPFVQQLAPNVSILGGSVGSYTTASNLNGASNVAALSVQYRGVGSVNGLSELVNYALNGALPLSTQLGDPAYLNRTTVSQGGSTSYTGTGGFPLATPITSIDAAVLDVSIPWGVQGTTGTPAWNLKPTAPGYGSNALLPINGSSQTNLLATLTSGGKSLNLNTASPDSKTIFSTPLAFAPISVVSNHGTGVQNVTQSQLAFLYVTGRMPDGTNLVAATRDIGSGTRNGIMNSVGVDPSWGVGENIGSITTNANIQSVLGPDFQPTNLDATGTMTNVVKNDRLAVGYVSTTTGKSSQASGAYETLGVKFNLEGGTDFVRPTASTLINNGTTGAAGTGYRIGGIETFGTVGDPMATAINANYPALTNNPQMANSAAAAYIRNIVESVKNYTANPSASSNTFMPAQTLLSSNFLPIGSLAQVQSSADGTSWIPNTSFSTAVSTDAANITGLNTGAYGSGVAPYGVVPTRENLTSGTYSDGQTISYRYFDSTGTQFTISAGQALNTRNAVDGDFSGDGQRNINDIPQLMIAAADPTAWAKVNSSGSARAGLGNAAIPELLGDFNSDGNFNAADVRYFADGLAIATTGPHAGQLDRKAAFTAIDNDWAASTPGHPAGNYFNTTLVTGRPYQAGDSRGDVAGSISGPSAGGAPTGADGIINVKDIDYVLHQIHGAMGAGTDGSFATLLARAAVDPTVNPRADLSADINGDLSLTFADAQDLVQNILGVPYGDANLNGVVDIQDLTIVANNWQKTANASWSNGDLNGDGIVDIQDFTLVANNWQQTSSSIAFGAAHSSAVPEPTSLALLASASIGLLAKRRRR